MPTQCFLQGDEGLQEKIQAQNMPASLHSWLVWFHLRGTVNLLDDCISISEPFGSLVLNIQFPSSRWAKLSGTCLWMLFFDVDLRLSLPSNHYPGSGPKQFILVHFLADRCHFTCCTNASCGQESSLGYTQVKWGVGVGNKCPIHLGFKLQNGGPKGIQF